MEKVVNNSAKPVYWINPQKRDISTVLGVHPTDARLFGFPVDSAKRWRILDFESIDSVSEVEGSSFVMSGVYGFEVELPDVGATSSSSNRSTDKSLRFFRELDSRRIPLVVVTECCDVDAVRQLSRLDNLVHRAFLPYGRVGVQYVLNCHAQGAILDLDKDFRSI